MIFAIEISVLILGILFLWITSIAGLKFYSSFEQKDVGQIRLAIHSTLAIIIFILCMLYYQGFISGNTQEDGNKVETEKVEAK